MLKVTLVAVLIFAFPILAVYSQYQDLFIGDWDYSTTLVIKTNVGKPNEFFPLSDSSTSEMRWTFNRDGSVLLSPKLRASAAVQSYTILTDQALTAIWSLELGQSSNIDASGFAASNILYFEILDADTILLVTDNYELGQILLARLIRAK